MDRDSDITAYSAGDHEPGASHRANDNHVMATGITIFVVFAAISAWAFPSVRDLSLFESVYGLDLLPLYQLARPRVERGSTASRTWV